MKYNTTYSQSVSLYETILFINELRNEILSFLKKNFKLNQVLAPAFFLETDVRNTEINEISRGITFDTAADYKVGRLSMSDSSFLRDLIIKTKTKPAHGFFSENAFVWRDLPETPTSSITKHELTVQVVNDEKSIISPEALAKNLYAVIYAFSKKLQLNKKIKNIYPEKIQVISAQNLEDEFSSKSANEREKEISYEQAAFILKNPTLKLRSGKTHINLPEEIYASDNFFQIALRDRINSEVLKVASIGEIAVGKKLLDQTQNLTAYKITELQNLFKVETKIMEIKVNLPRLAMAVLGKGHIVEVQPDVFSNEGKVVKLKYKVEAF